MTSKTKVSLKSIFYELEIKLYNDISEMRKKLRRVSNMFVRIHVLKILQSKLNDGTFPDGTCFKASHRWNCRCIKRKKLKFRQKKSGKMKAEMNIYLNLRSEWLHYVL